MTLVRVFTIGFAMALTCCATGCHWKGGSSSPAVGGGDAAGASNDQPWRLAPVRMRVYPSSRFTQQAGQTVLEARVELLDEMGDSVKGVGDFHFELFAGDRPAGMMLGRRAYSWDVPLLTLEDQRRYYDTVTRAYLFRLKIDEQALPQRAMTLHVAFMPAEGPRLEAQALLDRTAAAPVRGW